MKEIMDKARERMSGYCRVCRQCDGRACAGEVPGMGGLGTGSSFMNNIDALKAVKLNLRVLHQAQAPDLRCDFFGLALSMPVLAAPVGGASFNFCQQMSETEYTDAVARGCLRAGVAAGLGDSAKAEVVESSFKTLKEIGGKAIMFFKPWEQEALLAKLERLAGSGAPAVGMDIDAAGLITLALMGVPVSPKTPYQLREIVNHLPIPFIVKGVMTADEAMIALEAGAQAIVVSNHGGRVLDHTPGSAEALPHIAKLVKGRLKIMVDGGVRSGVDVLKMLALGADAVMIGRPIAIAAVGGGADGVVKYLDKIRAELTSAMVMTGCATVSEVSSRILAN
jgi:isopentenyl diphosphate isomerase/L-lactate dehydrogenase-like FMN-dependent dehydrogenase